MKSNIKCWRGYCNYKILENLWGIINAAGYSHTSVAIRDALSIFKKPIIEVHISNIYKREDFRHKSLISAVVTGIICGLGVNGYTLAINSMQELLKNEN